MIPKVASCTDAVRRGVPRVHMLDGRVAHALLLELFTDAGVGTMIHDEELPAMTDVMTDVTRDDGGT